MHFKDGVREQALNALPLYLQLEGTISSVNWFKLRTGIDKAGRTESTTMFGVFLVSIRTLFQQFISIHALCLCAESVFMRMR